MFTKIWTKKSIETYSKEFRNKIKEADSILIGAGSGLSTSAGFTYSGNRFKTYFSDFEKKYNFHDMYSGGFYPFDSFEEYWAYWSRYIYINRYMSPEKDTYQKLLNLIKDKEYFVLTTNVDHCFQKAGFDKKRIFYTQGDYGLFQCSEPCHTKTYDNQEIIEKMIQAQGLKIENGNLIPKETSMAIPSELIPYCPCCHKPMTMNLRADSTFVEDDGWYQAQERYAQFLEHHKYGKILFLEIGVGNNTPVIIKYNFWKQVDHLKNSFYININPIEAYAPEFMKNRSLCIPYDCNDLLDKVTPFKNFE